MEKPKFEEGVDYYLEDGFVIFTRSFLANRGYCCASKNSCRHCPYSQPTFKGNKELKKDEENLEAIE